jgi:hypothetical protein
MKKQMIVVGIIDHKYGTNTYAGKTKKSVTKQVASYCRKWWDENVKNTKIPEDNNEIIELYFDEENAGAWEGLIIQETELI